MARVPVSRSYAARAARSAAMNVMRRRMRRRYRARAGFPLVVRNMIAGPTDMQRRFDAARRSAAVLRGRGRRFAARYKALTTGVANRRARTAVNRWRAFVGRRRVARRAPWRAAGFRI